MIPDVARAGWSDLYALFRGRALARSDNLAIEWAGKSWTYRMLLERVDRLAAALLQRGVEPGDRIAILSHNRAEYVELQLAAAGIGAIVACLNWRLAAPELKHCIELVSPRLGVVEPELRASFEAVSDLPILEIGADWEEAITAAAPDRRTGTLVQEPEAGLTILYTSGTTGLPKGALISHRAHIARTLVFAAQLALDPADAFIAWAPMFHMASTDHALATLLRGGTVVMIDGLQPREINAALSRHLVGWLVMMPGAIEVFIAERRANPVPIKGVRVVGAMADLVPPHQIAELTSLLNAPYLNSFGATETGLPPATACLIPPGVVPERLSKRLSAFCEVRLVDPEGREVPDGTPGEVAVRGPTLFSGYWEAEETNRNDFRDGLFHMGDLFRRNPDGTVDFVDRAKYLIKTGGENVYPAEIERVLLAHPRVSDAAVVKAHDARWGESPVAFVSVHGDEPTEEELKQICRAELAGYKVPREFRIVRFEEFPRSTSGKIQRHVLENWLAKEGAKDQAGKPP